MSMCQSLWALIFTNRYPIVSSSGKSSLLDYFSYFAHTHNASLAGASRYKIESAYLHPPANLSYISTVGATRSHSPTTNGDPILRVERGSGSVTLQALARDVRQDGT